MAGIDRTVLESDATVLDDGTTLLEAALSDAAGQARANARENVAIQKGETILDTYRVESDAIEGGMGSVWRVHHTGWNVDLAMKRPQPQCFSTEKSKADFIHECEAWINLGLHPNIVSCYYVREISGTPSIFSEWMDGGSLECAIQKGVIYEGTEAAQKERLLDLTIQFARGLHYAHEAGLIHQDVKPDNVLLTKEGEAKVADFGLARARAILTELEENVAAREAADGGKTMLSPSGGYTPAYCSMEQMDGKPLTRRTDIYSWAVSVMEMYLRTRPWANGVVAGLSCASYFKQARVPMPEALKALLEQCLKSVPEDRPHDFAQIEAKLHEIYQAETGNLYPRPAPKSAADTADSLNNRALSFLDLGKPVEAERCWERALKQNQWHNTALYNWGIFRWQLGRIDEEQLRLSIKRVFEEREEGQSLLDDLSEQIGQIVIAHPYQPPDPERIALACISADERFLAYRSKEQEYAVLLDRRGCLPERQLAFPDARVCGAAFSVDGTQCFITGTFETEPFWDDNLKYGTTKHYNQFAIVSTDTGEILYEETFEAPGMFAICRLRVSRDGARVVGFNGMDMYVWELQKDRAVRRFFDLVKITGEIQIVGKRCIALHPNGKEAKFTCGGKTVYHIDLMNGTVRKEKLPQIEPVRAVAISPDGKILASGGVDISR